MLTAWIKEMRDWIEAPFIGAVSVQTLFLLTGLVLVFILMWNIILFHIRSAAETL